MRPRRASSWPLRIAHRGVPRREPENTLASFALALAEGADGIELDVHVTADGVVVVHHDANLADGRAISALPLGELRETPGPREIPTLAEVFEVVRARAELFVEIKGSGIEVSVSRALEDYDGPASIHSFDHDAIRRLSAKGEHRRLGVLTDSAVPDCAALLEDTGARDYWPRSSHVNESIVQMVHTMGARVIPWTVNTPRRMRALSAMGVDGICTDDVGFLTAVLAER